MGSLREFAEAELRLLGNDQEYNDYILKVVDTFAEYGHSGSSAAYTVGLLEKLLSYKPIAPLTGEESEWMEVGEGVYQNNRCSTVFKQRDRFNGQAYDIEGKVFIGDSGSYYTNMDSFVPVSFPYTPKTVYVSKSSMEGL